MKKRTDLKIENKKSDNGPLVWQYTCYRSYLEACLVWKKNENTKYSYRYFAKVLGTTPGFLKLVTSRKRNISLDKIIKISNVFKQTVSERQYFIFLFLENISTEKEMKVYFKSILKGFTPEGVLRDPIVEAEAGLKYLAPRDWLMFSISGLAACHNYEHRVDWIHEQLGGDMVASKTRIQEAIDRLIELGVLKQKENGSWGLEVQSQLRSGNPFDLDYLQIYKSGLTRCLLAVDLIGKTNIHEPKSLFMNMIAVNEDDQNKVLELYRKFTRDVFEITHASVNPDRVMMISNNIISLNGKP